jgi:hypothetical protein
MLAVVAPSIYGRSASALRRTGTRQLQEGLQQHGNNANGGDRPALLSLWDAVQGRSYVGAAGAPQWGRLLSSSSSGKSGDGPKDGSKEPDGGTPAGDGPHVVEGEVKEVVKEVEDAAKEAAEKSSKDDGKGGVTLLDRLNPFKRAASKKDPKEAVTEQDAGSKETAAVKEIVLEEKSGDENAAEKDSRDAPKAGEGESVLPGAMVPSSPRPENFPTVNKTLRKLELLNNM